MPRALVSRAAPSRAALASLALAAALAAPSVAAQGKPRPAQPGAARPEQAPLARPAQAAPVPSATAAIALPPPPSGTTLQRRDEAASLAVGVGPYASFSSGDAIALHVDYGVVRTPPAWRRLALEYRLAVLLARPTKETALTRFVPSPYAAYGVPGTTIPSGVEQASAWVVSVAPTARVRIAWEKFAMFADGGVGLVQTVERYERDETFIGRSERTENVTGLVLRAGAGMSFDLSPRARLLLQPLAFAFLVGPELSAYTPSLGLSFRL